MDSWVGRLEDIHQKLTVVFPDGAKCRVIEHDFLEMDKFSPESQSDVRAYYLCQHLFINSEDVYIWKCRLLIQRAYVLNC